MKLGTLRMGKRPYLAKRFETLASRTYDQFKVRQLAPTIGAEVEGVQLARLDEAGIADVRRALLDHRVLFFRNQDLTIEQHKAFAEHFGYYIRRLLPFAANASLSRQLTSAEQEALGCEESWGVTPANASASITMRYTNDHRILIRNNIYYNPKMRETQNFREQIARRHKELFDQRFPMLPNVEMEYFWTGFICLSQNGAPGFGRLADNVYSSVCQNAIGVTKGTAGGVLAADMACGVDNELIAYMLDLGQPNKLPPRPFLDLGVKARMAWELWNARREV